MVARPGMLAIGISLLKISFQRNKAAGSIMQGTTFYIDRMSLNVRNRVTPYRPGAWLTVPAAHLSPGWFAYVLVSICLVFSTVAMGQVLRAKTSSSRATLQRQIEQLAQPAQGRVGVAARVLEEDKSVSWHGQAQYPMQSVYKLPIGMVVLHQIDSGKLSFSQKVQVSPDDYISPQQHSPIRDKFPKGVQLSVNELLRYAVSESDGSASDVLLRLVGGPKVVMQYLNRLGIRGIQVQDTEKAIGQDYSVQYRNWAQPDAMVDLLAVVQAGRGLSAPSQKRLLGWMTQTPTSSQRLKGKLPPGTIVAHKTGSSGMRNGIAAATNDVGLITLPNGQHLAVAVFVSDARADEAVREKVIAAITQLLWTSWQN